MIEGNCQTIDVVAVEDIEVDLKGINIKEAGTTASSPSESDTSKLTYVRAATLPQEEIDHRKISNEDEIIDNENDRKEISTRPIEVKRTQVQFADQTIEVPQNIHKLDIVPNNKETINITIKNTEGEIQENGEFGRGTQDDGTSRGNDNGETWPDKEVDEANRSSNEFIHTRPTLSSRASISSLNSPPHISKLITILQKYGYHLEIMNEIPEPQQRIHSTDAISNFSLEEQESETNTDIGKFLSASSSPSGGIDLSSRATSPSISSINNLSNVTLINLREPRCYQTALHIAAKKGHLNVIQALARLPYIKDLINIQDKHCNTALHFIAASTKSNAVDMWKLLTRLGAIPDIFNIRSLTPLATHILTRRNDTSDLLELILKSMNCETKKEEAFLKLQYNRPVYINPTLNAVVCEGKTMVHYMIEKKFVNIARQLIIAGASLNIPDKNGNMISELLPKKTLASYIKYMNEGQQAPPETVIRAECKLCKTRNAFNKYKDCYLCGRTICKKCSRKVKEILKEIPRPSYPSPTRLSIRSPVKTKASPTPAASSSQTTECKNRYCNLCITIMKVNSMKDKDRRHFNEQFTGI